MALPELYKEQEYQRQTFDKDSEFKRLYGVNASRSNVRKFNRYWNSDQRTSDEKAFNEAQDAAELAHIEAEAKKRAESWDARIAALREQNAARGNATLNNINASLASKPAIPSLVLKDAARWNQVASQYGFKDYNDVAAWQKENGLEADGKFGAASYAKWSQLNPDKVGTVPVIKPKIETLNTSVRSVDETSPDFIGSRLPSAKDSSASVEGAISTSDQDALDSLYYNNKDYTRTRLDDGTFGYRHNLTGTMYLAGNKVKDLLGATGSVSNGVVTWDIPDTEAPGAVKYNSKAQMQRAVQDAFYQKYGRPYRTYEVEDESVYASADPEYQRMLTEFQSQYKSLGGGRGYEYVSPELAAREQAWLKYNPVPTTARSGEKYNNWRTQYWNAKKVGFRKQGGTMNRINYFQQGGAVPQQQDMQAQVVALVQAAMQGDQKATQTVNQIMEAAKAGDQQAIQIAQLMEQVIKQMQGQATAAKYGAKLNYLQSLKCGGKSMKKKEQGGKVCPECEKQAKTSNKTLITKHQQGKTLDYNKATRFYSKWSEADIRKLKVGLAGYAGYEGDVNSGKVDKEMIDAVAKLQGEKKVTSDGMWGHNSNTQIRLVDSSTADKGSYKKTWGTEQGSLRTYDVAGQKMKDQDYYKAINNLKEQFYANPEAFWNAGGNTAKWREHLYTTPEGTAIMEEFYNATPEDVREKLGSKVTNRKMQQDQMDSGIRNSTDRAARVAVTKVLPAMGGIVAAPVTLANPITAGLAIGGGMAGRKLAGSTAENLVGNDTSTWTSVDGMGTVASVATPTSEIVVPIAEAAGGAAGAALGAWGSQYVGTPSTQGLASFRRTNNSAPQFTGRSQNRSGRFKTGGYSLGQEPVQITKGRLGSYTTLGKQPRWANGPFGGQFAKKNSKGMSEDFIRYMEGAKGNPSYSVEFLGM